MTELDRAIVCPGSDIEPPGREERDDDAEYRAAMRRGGPILLRSRHRMPAPGDGRRAPARQLEPGDAPGPADGPDGGRAPRPGPTL